MSFARELAMVAIAAMVGLILATFLFGDGLAEFRDSSPWITFLAVVAGASFGLYRRNRQRRREL